jgi:hypothetical protein
MIEILVSKHWSKRSLPALSHSLLAEGVTRMMTSR